MDGGGRVQGVVGVDGVSHGSVLLDLLQGGVGASAAVRAGASHAGLAVLSDGDRGLPEPGFGGGVGVQDVPVDAEPLLESGEVVPAVEGLGGLVPEGGHLPQAGSSGVIS